jgi:hypothetical protein
VPISHGGLTGAGDGGHDKVVSVINAGAGDDTVSGDAGSDRCSMRARSARYRQQIMTVGVLKNGGSYPYKGPATQPIQNVTDFKRS